MKYALALAALLIASPATAMVSATNATPGSVDAGHTGACLFQDGPCFLERTVTLPESGPVADVDLDVLNFSFRYNEGTLTLSHGGIMARVFHNYHDPIRHPEGRYSITLDDEATGTLPDRCFEFACRTNLGSFRPDSPLSIFDGMDAFGDWTLIVGDWDSGDPTFIQSFTLRVMTAAPELVMTAASVMAVSEPPLLILAMIGALMLSLRRRHD